MYTIYNMTILNLKYTLPFVLGMLAFEVIIKGLISAICGHLHIDDFFIKLKISPQEEDNLSNRKHYSGFLDYDWKPMTHEESEELKRKLILKNSSNRSVEDIETRLGRYK